LNTHVFVDINCYRPVDAEDFSIHGKYSKGEIVQFSVRLARFYPLLQKYWACCNMIAQNKRLQGYEYYNIKEKVDLYCRMQTGLIDCTIVTDKVTIIKPKSISYDAMDQDEFQNYYDKAIDVMSFMSGISRIDIERNWHLYKTKVA
jgi:hypothetical protein